MVHYEPVKVTRNAPGLAEVIINVVMWHHDLLDSIICDRGAILGPSSGPRSATSSVSRDESPACSTLK